MFTPQASDDHGRLAPRSRYSTVADNGPARALAAALHVATDTALAAIVTTTTRAVADGKIDTVTVVLGIFVARAGRNATAEALYYGIPTVLVPVTADRHRASEQTGPPHPRTPPRRPAAFPLPLRLRLPDNNINEGSIPVGLKDEKYSDDAWRDAQLRRAGGTAIVDERGDAGA